MQTDTNRKQTQVTRIMHYKAHKARRRHQTKEIGQSINHWPTSETQRIWTDSLHIKTFRIRKFLRGIIGKAIDLNRQIPLKQLASHQIRPPPNSSTGAKIPSHQSPTNGTLVRSRPSPKHQSRENENKYPRIRSEISPDLTRKRAQSLEADLKRNGDPAIHPPTTHTHISTSTRERDRLHELRSHV